MNIVNIGSDKSLVGGRQLGDAIERHREYGKYVDHLDIIVYTNQRERLKPFKISENVFGYPTDSLAKIFFIFDTLRIFKKVNSEHQADIVVCQDPFIPALIGWYLKKKYGVKLQINFHGDFLDNPYWLKESWKNYFYKIIAEKTIYFADALRVTSGRLKKKLIDRGIPAGKIYVVSTPVNLEKFKVNQVPVHLANRILTVGRVVKSKDFPTLIKAAALVKETIPDFEWLIIGDGPLLAKFKKQTSHQAYLKWLGQIAHSQLAVYYQQASLIVLTSHNESFGKVLLEGAMAQKPAVATDTSGAQEIIEDNVSGYIVPIGDYKKLAEKIIHLVKNPELAKKMGERAYQLVQEKFGWQKNINAIIAVWRKLAERI